MRMLHRRSADMFAGENVDTEGTWAISYGDMVTLLLSFFVLFFTVDPQHEAQEKLQNTLVMRLNEFSLVGVKEGAKSVLKVGRQPGSAIEPSIVKEWGGQVHKLGKKIIIEFPGTSFFSIGNVQVNAPGRQALKSFVQAYLPFAGQFTVGVHAFTDARPVRSRSLRYKDNLELSALRSVSAMRVLQGEGIPLHRMRLGGYGELQITGDDLKAVYDSRGAKDPLALARKIILIIEPETMDEEAS